ncbi:hypothetical protein [Streptomyces sp. NPDC059894]|uniref:hypothetical protein n=1 Tax=unclassified Streptomyces TaxID=2593676 RepID=UPI003665E9D4
MNTAPLPASLVAGLCDDAAVFPPGNLPLAQAVPAHVGHLRSSHRDLVGPLVVAAKDLDKLAEVVAGLPEKPADGELDVAVTVPLPQVAEAVAATARIPSVRLRVLEVALPGDSEPGDVTTALRTVLGKDPEVTVFVEVPRDTRRDAVLDALAGTPYLAKFRTGGVRAEFYPDESELAACVLAAVRAGVPFKATAGLHHALRNTDPATGFEQHGFLNLLAATGAALDGADEAELVPLLADRDGARVSEQVRALPSRVREAFRSFGTCSIVEPVAELAGLGLVTPDTSKDVL